MSALLSIRSILFHTYKTDLAVAGAGKSSLWMPLHKPYNYKMLELKAKKKQAAHNLLEGSHVDSEASLQLAIYLIEMENEFFTTILPYASMKKKQFKELLVGGGIGQNQFKKCAASSKLLSTNENDPSFFMDDENGVQQAADSTSKPARCIYAYESEQNLNIDD